MSSTTNPSTTASIEIQRPPPADLFGEPSPEKTPAADLIETLLAHGMNRTGVASAVGIHPAQITRILKGEQQASAETHRRLLALVESGLTPDCGVDDTPAPAAEACEPAPAIPVTHDKDEPVQPPAVEVLAEISVSGGDSEPGTPDDAESSIGEPLVIALANSVTGPVTETRRGTWRDLASLLGTVRAGCKDGPLWIAGDHAPGPRGNEHVRSVSVLALDIEAKTQTIDGIKRAVGPEPPTFADMLAEVQLAGWRSVAHTSYSHLDPAIHPVEVEHQRYRLVFALSRPLAPAELDPLGRHVAGLLGVADCFDPALLKPSQPIFLPRCPAERLEQFQHASLDGEPLDVDALLDEARRIRESLRQAAQQRQGPKLTGVIDAFNAAHPDIGAILREHGYRAKGRGRWLHPESSTGLPGVRLIPESNPPRVFSSHGCCPLNDGHAHDAFDCWRILANQGDTTAAVREAARLLGMDAKPKKSEVDIDGILVRIAAQAAESAQDARSDAESQEQADTRADAGNSTEGDSAAQDTNAQREEKKKWGLIPVGDLLDPPEPLAWLVKDYLMPGTLAQVFGDPGSGKSLLTLDWAASVATGRGWQGREVKQAPVVYLAGEGHFGIRRRLKAWAVHHGAEDALRAAPMAVSSGGAGLAREETFTAVVLEIDAFVARYGQPALIVVDTVHRHFEGEENSSDDWANFLRAMDALTTRYGATVLLVHHSGHGDKTRSRGSSAIRGAMDTEYCLLNEQGARTLTTTKMKDAPTPRACSFTLEQIELPWKTADGESETSVVLVESGGHDDGWRKSSVSQTQRLAFETLLDAIDENGFSPPDHVAESLPDGAQIVSLENWRRAFYARHMGDSSDAKKKAFQRARMDLAKLGGIGHRDDCYWSSPGCGGVSELQAILNARSLLKDLKEARNA